MKRAERLRRVKIFGKAKHRPCQSSQHLLSLSSDFEAKQSIPTENLHKARQSKAYKLGRDREAEQSKEQTIGIFTKQRIFFGLLQLFDAD